MEKKRTMYSLESDIRRILENNDFVDADGDERAKQWYMNLITDLAVFVQQELDKAREEGREEIVKSVKEYVKNRSKTLLRMTRDDSYYREAEIELQMLLEEVI